MFVCIYVIRCVTEVRNWFYYQLFWWWRCGSNNWLLFKKKIRVPDIHKYWCFIVYVIKKSVIICQQKYSSILSLLEWWFGFGNHFIIGFCWRKIVQFWTLRVLLFLKKKKSRKNVFGRRFCVDDRCTKRNIKDGVQP